ncbi:family 31 glycosyl hydrolase, alpha-glucosidase [Echinicola vietnamensis DSM 17526]|uniref:Family 31 glycosyl hydrolase, alpha-glucosidase n=2 Tax=Echinicola TaxID=390846 RepID=L0G5X7_ECHVK|nr:family 31 glycosyl hydrolase, alpha-glucosidase [Echinicola vietnamensis DSM 17526]
MSLTKLIYTFVMLVLLYACAPSAGENFPPENGITITLPSDDPYSPKQVRLEVITENIIRVTSSPLDTRPVNSSLMIIDQLPSPPAWEKTETADSVGLQTAKVQAWISKSTGEVTFKDASGKLILQEAKAGKAFGPPADDLEDDAVFSIQQRFKSPENEAFYGLGQQQTGLFNYKGYHVDLTQYNSVVAVPFMVSSRNYGILWDNYSITKFGDDREPMPLSELRLFDANGKEGFLTATYANDPNRPNEGLKEQEGHIAYTFLDDLNKIPKDFDMANGTATWQGSLQARESGVHRFHMTYSGYVKVWADGQLLVDRWRESWNPGPLVFELPLDTEKATAFKIEWIPESTQSFLSVKFLPPDRYRTTETYAFRSEAGKMLDYYFVAGQDMDELISGYRQLTGKAQIMPKWAMGFWQSRERYKTQEELLSTVAEYRKRHIPLDNIVQDWSYWPEDAWGSHDFDPARFPDPVGMIDQVHDQYHAHIMISVWPKFYEGIEHYKQFDEKGWLYKQNILNRQRDWIGEGYISTFYDAFNPGARELFWKQINEKLYQKGIDAWWLDATEPDVLSNASIQHRKTLMNPTALGTATEYFNGYPLVNAKGIYHGQRATNPDDRVFILTRSAFPGIQRYGAATWSGDISARFDELEQQIPAGLNFSLSGLPYWTTDIGGFFVEDKYDRPDPKGEALEEWRELNTRWYQYGTFTPLYRSHGQYPYREVFNIAPEGHPAYRSIVFYNKLRYRLMPYIYSLTGKVHHDDYTIMRPLIMDFDHDPRVGQIKDQFMFGPSILVNPVYHYEATNRDIYFPKETGWYDLLTGEYQAGGVEKNIEAPYDKIPLFVKAGSIIPFGPKIEYTDEKPADEITLYVYAGQNGYFELYEDQGSNYEYEQGQFSIIPLTYDENTKTLTIGAQEGEFEGMLTSRTFHVIYVQKDRPTGYKPDATTEKAIHYTGQSMALKLDEE